MEKTKTVVWEELDPRRHHHSPQRINPERGITRFEIKVIRYPHEIETETLDVEDGIVDFIETRVTAKPFRDIVIDHDTGIETESQVYTDKIIEETTHYTDEYVEHMTKIEELTEKADRLRNRIKNLDKEIARRRSMDIEAIKKAEAFNKRKEGGRADVESNSSFLKTIFQIFKGEVNHRVQLSTIKWLQDNDYTLHGHDTSQRLEKLEELKYNDDLQLAVLEDEITQSKRIHGMWKI